MSCLGDETLVVINGRAAIRVEIGGVERWATELADRLPLISPDLYRVTKPQRYPISYLAQLWEQLILPLKAKRSMLILSPANLAPVLSKKNVVVIHDLSVFYAAESYSKPYLYWHRFLLKQVVKSAVQIITVSYFIKQQLIDYLHLEPEKISVIYGGVDFHKFKNQKDSSKIRRLYGLESPYALFVGSKIARKNLSSLKPTVEYLKSVGMELVVVGSGRSYFQEGENSLSDVRYLGYLPDIHLPAIYKEAELFILPSFYEGFGLPCLEAMASGTPVVASFNSALPEVCADAALFVDPENPEEIKAVVSNLLSDSELQTKLITAGYNRAAELTWQHSIERVDSLLKELLVSN